MDVMDPEHVVDTLLFFAIGMLSWAEAAMTGSGWLLLFGLPWWVMFLVSVWRVIR
jgi:uncharacterized protein (DUF58 family)